MKAVAIGRAGSGHGYADWRCSSICMSTSEVTIIESRPLRQGGDHLVNQILLDGLAGLIGKAVLIEHGLELVPILAIEEDGFAGDNSVAENSAAIVHAFQRFWARGIWLRWLQNRKLLI